MNTQVVEKESTLTQEDVKHTVVLFNDEVNTFDHVINLLVKVCDHDSIQAEQCAMLVHYKGKCVVKSGALEEMERITSILSDNNLTVEIQ